MRDDRPVGVGPHDDLLELVDRRQTALGRDRNRDVDPPDRSLAEHAGRRFAVLVLEHRLQVLDRQPQVGQLVGLHPDAHGVVAAADVRHAAHAGHTAQQVEDVEGRIVRQVDLVEFRIRGEQRDGHQPAGGLLLDRDAVLHHLSGQARLGLFQPVLNIDSSQIGVGRDVEGHRGGETARIGARRLHVDHARSTVQLLLDRGGYGLRDGLRIGSRVGGGDPYHGRNDLRILVDGQQRQAYRTDDDDDDGQHRREDGMVEKKVALHHSASRIRGSTFMPCESLWYPSTTIRSPAARPRSITVLLPASGPVSTKRFSTTSSVRTT